MTDQHVRIGTGQTLKEFLNMVIDEGIKSSLTQKALQEKEKQDATTNDIDKLFGPGEGAEDAQSKMPDVPKSEDKPSATMADDTEKLKTGDVSPKDIVEKLNSIRSGKSFKDSAVSGAIDQYVSSLSKAERVSLMAFLKGIAQIVTAQIDAQQATEPAEHPSDIRMRKTNEPHTFHKKPNVMKRPGTETKPAPVEGEKPAEEDTTAPKSTPAPITPKKRK